MAKPSRSPGAGAAPRPAGSMLAALALGAALAACGTPAAPSPGGAGPAAVATAVPSDAGGLAQPAGGEIGPFRSDHGTFEVWYRSEPAPVPLNALHAWVVRVVDADGAAVDGASIAVSGGMPAQGHAHGLPTHPSIAAGPAAGEYRVEGLKFHMPGPWEVYLDIATPDGRGDRATIRLDL